ncbi:10928_t:CDS:2 [Paraglomus brasilianum]|uniref:10928_t:CDS:1 n=1 Tax=Paraglomus brasilianum TaxID=144538 RepID=A0A9N9BG30_9GLOM|nr:10928_t:CDS:2 [Paraglomus brasilianum]
MQLDKNSADLLSEHTRIIIFFDEASALLDKCLSSHILLALTWWMMAYILAISGTITAVENIMICIGGSVFLQGKCYAQVSANSKHYYMKIFDMRKPEPAHSKLAFIRSPNFTPRKSKKVQAGRPE